MHLGQRSHDAMGIRPKVAGTNNREACIVHQHRISITSLLSTSLVQRYTPRLQARRKTGHLLTKDHGHATGLSLHIEGPRVHIVYHYHISLLSALPFHCRATHINVSHTCLTASSLRHADQGILSPFRAISCRSHTAPVKVLRDRCSADVPGSHNNTTLSIRRPAELEILVNAGKVPSSDAKAGKHSLDYPHQA